MPRGTGDVTRGNSRKQSRRFSPPRRADPRSPPLFLAGERGRGAYFSPLLFTVQFAFVQRAHFAPTNAFFVGFGETTIKVTIGIDHAGGRESSGGSDASRTPELPRSTAHSLGRRIVPPEEPGSAWQEPGDALYQGLVQPPQLPQPASETASPMRASPPLNLRAK